MNKQDTNTQLIIIEELNAQNAETVQLMDLTVNEEQSDKVKGGYTLIELLPVKPIDPHRP